MNLLKLLARWAAVALIVASAATTCGGPADSGGSPATQGKDDPRDRAAAQSCRNSNYKLFRESNRRFKCIINAGFSRAKRASLGVSCPFGWKLDDVEYKRIERDERIVSWSCFTD